MILGYGGTNDVNLAMQRGEVDATCGLFLSSVLGPFGDDIKEGDLKIIVQFGRKDDPDSAAPPTSTNCSRARRTSRLPISCSCIRDHPPDRRSARLVEDVADTLKKAFDDTMRDPEFIADATKANIQVGPMSSAEVSKAFADFAAMPKAVLDRAKDAVTRQ